ncbi:hypothetical protein [Idiomarina aminovorans]|uniref:hypothetical protein n=1 Tax=Idiomarina aminovorans TaxID=2914829 RepID=UPI0020064B82|nr:hypothetical protein [Idiomarina sp. ATCH4]MCK7459053.1 hypothetical protein [Idiomarina sp. ATCH4]
MKTLTVILVLVTALLVGSFSSPAVHAMPMPMPDTVSASSHDMSQHECCDEADLPMEPSSCDSESSFCQQCDQHCAGQLALMNPFKQLSPAALTHAAAPIYSNLPVITETLIRPPKHAV